MSVLGGHQNTSDEQAMATQFETQLRSNPAFANWAAMQANQRGLRTKNLSEFGIAGAPPGWVVNQAGHIYKPEGGWLVPLVAGVGLGAGAGLAIAGGPAVASAAGGSQAAAGGALPATIPGSAASGLYASGGFGVPGGTAAGVAAGTGGLAAAGDVANTIPVGGLRPTNGGNGSGAAGGLLSQLTSGQGLAGLAGLLTTLATRPNSGSGGSGDAFATNPQLQHLLDVAGQRVDRTDPLHQSITQLAMSRLPTNVQR